MTAREKEAKEKTVKFLNDNGIRFNEILFEMPMGERILINDDKPSGLRCAYAITPTRNQGLENLDVIVDGPYIDELRDISLKWRGSLNQRVIDVQSSLKLDQVVLWCD